MTSRTLGGGFSVSGRIYKEQVIEMMAARMGCSRAQTSDALGAALSSLEDALQRTSALP